MIPNKKRYFMQTDTQDIHVKICMMKKIMYDDYIRNFQKLLITSLNSYLEIPVCN